MYHRSCLFFSHRARGVLWLILLTVLIAVAVPTVVSATMGAASPGGAQNPGWSKSQPLNAALSAESLSAASESEAAGEVIVEFARGTQSQAMLQTASASGVTLEWARPSKSSKAIPFAVYRSSSLSTEQLTAQLKSQPGVVAVSPNHRLRLATTGTAPQLRTAGAGYAKPNDPLFGSQWALENTGQVAGMADADIDGRAAWERTLGSSDVVVAVIDSGVDYEHPDLAANIWKNTGETAQPYDGHDNDGSGYIDDVYGIDVVNGDSDPFDDYGHGTHVAGIIAAAAGNGVGVTGVAPKVKIMALKAFDASGDGYEIDVIECIYYVLDMKAHGVNVVAINASFGGDVAGDLSDDPLYNAIKAARDAGIVFVAAADNNGRDIDATPRYPASYNLSNIIAVGASDSYDSRAEFSNYGASGVDLFAPGVGILSTIPPLRVPGPGSGTLFYDDMESGTGKWTKSGTWAITGEVPVSGTSGWSDSPEAAYPKNSQYALTTRSVNLSAAVGSGAWLGFAIWHDFGRGDGLIVGVSGNDGGSWQEVHRFTGTSDQYYGQYYWVKLPAAAITGRFKLQFVLKSGAFVTDVGHDGAYIDDVCITTATPQLYMGNASGEEMSGTSMAAPHVTGTVALLAAVAPSDSMAKRINRILSTVDKPVALGGLCVTNGRLNAGRAVAKIAPVPTISQILPKAGPILGGTNVDIYGTNFYGVSLAGAGGVTFGGVNALSYTVASSEHITAAVPPGVEGTTVRVEVRAARGATVDAGTGHDFTYVGLPTIGGMSAATGPDVGGVSVNISGTNFVDVSSVTFGGVKAQGFWLEASGKLKAIVPAHVAGTVRVIVTAAGGSTPDGAFDSYTYVATSAVQQNDPRLAHLGGWTEVASPYVSGGSYASGDSPGCVLTVTFQGTYLALVVKTDSYGGKAWVRLDGQKVGYVDFYSASARYRQNVYNTGMLGSGPHTVSLEWAGSRSAGSRGYGINVDAVRVLGTVTQAPGAALYQQNNTHFKYMGPWATSVTSSASGGSFATVDGPGASARITFKGTYLALNAKTAPWYGKAQVRLDGGAPKTLDLYSSTQKDKQRIYSTGLLENTSHTLSIYWTGTKNPAASGTRVSIDSLNIIGTLTAAPVAKPILWRYQETEPKITYLGSWSTGSTSSASGGSFRSTGARGAAAIIKFSGTSVSLLAKKAPWYGKGTVTLDGGTPVTVDFYNATQIYRQAVYRKTGLSAGPHTLTIRCDGAKRAASSGYSISLDALDTGYLVQAPKAKRYQQDDSKVGYAGIWTTGWSSSALGGSYVSGNVAGAKITLCFTGSYVAWKAKTAPWYGKAKVTLDGSTPVTVDLYSSAQLFGRMVYDTGLLANKPHTLVIQWTGSKRSASSGTAINADAFEVLGTLEPGTL